MKRKLLKIFLPVILCAAASVVTESRVCPINFGTLVYAGETENIETGIEISQLAAPSGVLAPGSAFGISGVIDNSAGELTRIYGGIYKSDGKTPASYCEDTLTDGEYSLSTKFDNDLTFNTLSPGKYFYIIYVTDKSGNTVTAVKSDFSVAEKGAFPSNINIAQYSLPADTLPLGCDFRAIGAIYSSYALTSVKVGVYGADGKEELMSFSDSPYTSVYDLKAKADKKLSFSKLPAGSYIYRAEATDLLGNSKTVLEKAFTVAEKAPSEISVCGETTPTGKIREGYGLWVKGSIYSANSLKSVTAGIYKSGKAVNKHTASFRAGRNYYDLGEMDNYLLFNTLSEGDYLYKVTATDIKGKTTTLINAPFKVINASSEKNTTPALDVIDISSHNGEVDWEKVKAAGVEYVILRAGRTSTTDANYAEDPMFDENYKKAKAAGLKVGAYIYTVSFNKTETEYSISQLLKTLKGKTFDLPVFIDMENDTRYVPLGKELNDIADYGCELIEKGGYKAGVYASLNYFTHYIKTDTKKRGIWLASYPTDHTVFNYSDFCDIWQYNTTETIDGVEGAVDKSYMYMTE